MAIRNIVFAAGIFFALSAQAVDPLFWGQEGFKPGMEPLPGHKLVKRIGTGAWGEVWEADGPNGKVALKFIPIKHKAAIVEERTAYEFMRTLPEHPNVLRLGQWWSYAGFAVISMELAPDGTLHDIIDQLQAEGQTGGCDMRPVVDCLKRVAAGLDFLNITQHRIQGRKCGIQHCDVKPANMFLFGEEIKIGDFGFTATLTGRDQRTDRQAGTGRYMPPEAFNGLLTSTTDQYSLAVSYYELRTGRRLFPEPQGAFQVGYRHPNPDLSKLSIQEANVVRRALDPNHLRRWPSCGTFVEALDKVERLLDGK